MLLDRLFILSPMNSILNRLKNNALIKNGFVLASSTMVVNILAYLYNIIVGRMVGPDNYGVFSSLISIMYIITVFTYTVVFLVAKFCAQYYSVKDMDSIYSIFKYATKKTLYISIILFIILAAVSPVASSFLKTRSVIPILILDASLLIVFVTAVNRGVLQGTFKFFSLAVNNAVEMVLRIVISFFLIYIGWSINGALWGLALGILGAYLLSFISMKDILKEGREKIIDTRSIKIYALPLILSYLGMTLLYTVDIILAQHYLSDYNAGIYSALSNFGKIIFFSSSSIVVVLFPMAAERSALGQKHSNLLRDSVIIVSVISVILLGIFFLMPNLLVKLFFGKEFMEAAPYLVSFGMVMFVYSIINVYVNYYLSVNKTKIAYLPFIFSILLVILMVLFHNSIEQIIYIRMIHMILLLMGVLAFNFFFSKIKLAKAYVQPSN